MLRRLGGSAGGFRIRAVLAVVVVLLSSACVLPQRLSAVPAEQTVKAQPELGPVRYWPNRDPDAFTAAAVASIDREKAWLARSGHTGPLPPVTFLAVSGGGDDGAFGAGLLVGWTRTGTRPEFRAVTGVSTGALIAPFAFLGPRYDPELTATYTQVSQRDIFTPRWITAALWGDAMADSRPLARLVRKYVTRQMLDQIAVEYAKGRMLLIGTTDLDSREPVIWDMGAIASSKDPHALELFQRILVASSAIPGAFPPVMIDVTVDGRRYQEMHVDGGATRQLFVYPPSVRLAELGREHGSERSRTLYLIRNARLDPDWASVDRRTLSIANRAVSALIQTQGVGDLDRIYLTARRDGLDYNLAYIPSTFTTPRRKQFDPVYMRALYDLGEQMAEHGYPWAKRPPGFGEESPVAPPEPRH